MVCTANDLQEWKDFPKGLRVLLLDQDSDSASEITSKLQAMDYTVSIFCNETEAVSAFSSKPESFHLAIVEVNTNNEDGTFEFLETAKELPIILTSNTQCLSTMMKCIALGAVEFLRKPLSEDKLKNIWQHVVHKAFNAGNLPAKDIEPALHLKLEKEESEDKVSMGTLDSNEAAENKYPAPSTPQLSQAARLLDDGDCQDQTICSTEQDGESKSVEITCGDSIAAEVTLNSDPPEIPEDSSGQPRESESSPPKKTIERAENPRVGPGGASNSVVSKSSRKKMKVDWTADLHKKFVRAVEQLGVDQAIPSRILELMNVESLTRHNVASHLQKYRMHKRHILPKEDEQRWARPREPLQRSCYPQHPPPPHVMAFPAYHSTHAVPVGPVYPPMWGPPHAYHPPPWQPAETWHWNPYPGVPPQVQANAWGCPVMPQPQPPHAAYATYSQNTSGFHRVTDNVYDATKTLCDLQPADEVVDKVVKEAINKPWLPLPLGLKPPSTDSVLSELSRQGISTIPPHITPSR